MPSLFFQDMKGVNLACTTPASTAICASIADRAVASPGGGGGGRAIDRHNPHLHDHRRAKPQAKPVPQPSSKNFRYFNIKKIKKSSEQPICGQISPGSSSRFLLDNDIKLSDVFAEPMEMTRSQSCKREEVHELVDVKLKASSSTRPQNQVVILRVSLHCKGCEGKVRKHISKMEGVKSFSIDFAAKKVTVIGEVTPLGVLNSISKVKNAQFWPSSADSPVASF